MVNGFSNSMNSDTTKNVHHLFASFFEDNDLYPIVYLLSKAMDEGHICIQLTEKTLPDLINEEIPFDANSINLCVLDENALVTSNPKSQRSPFVWVDQKLYSFRYWQYEHNILNKVIELRHSAEKKRQKRIDLLIREGNVLQSLQGTYPILSNSPSLNTDWQLIAAINGYLNQLSIITGGPGTGKTTTISKLLQIILHFEPDSRIMLAAPTGKAAARMKESLHGMHQNDKSLLGQKVCSLSAQTIHQLLGSIRHSIYFKHNPTNPLPYDVLIIDEASMIDVGLMAKLICSVDQSSRIIFLGDKNQLASVEAGSIFGDLCLSVNPINHYSESLHQLLNDFIDQDMMKIASSRIVSNETLLSRMTTELLRSFRFSDDGFIGKWAVAILKNSLSQLLDTCPTSNDSIQLFFEQDDAVFHDPNYSEAILDQFCLLYTDYILENDIRKAIDKMQTARILCATKMGPQGTENMNRYVELMLSQRGYLHIDHPFYENRPVMVRKNNRSLGLSNGDIGLVRKDENGITWVYFNDENGQLKRIQPAYLGDAQTVFAMTIHKSQGSEYTNILTCIPKDGSSKILTKELLYTAVTRAKKRVIVQGSRERLIACCEREVRRASGIIDSLRKVDLSCQ